MRTVTLSSNLTLNSLQGPSPLFLKSFLDLLTFMNFGLPPYVLGVGPCECLSLKYSPFLLSLAKIKFYTNVHTKAVLLWLNMEQRP